MGSTTPHDDRPVPPMAETVSMPTESPATPPPADRVVPLRRAPAARVSAPPEDDDPGPQAA